MLPTSADQKNFYPQLTRVCVSVCLQDIMCTCDDIIEECVPARLAALVLELTTYPTYTDRLLSLVCLVVLTAVCCFLYWNSKHSY